MSNDGEDTIASYRNSKNAEACLTTQRPRATVSRAMLIGIPKGAEDNPPPQRRRREIYRPQHRAKRRTRHRARKNPQALKERYVLY